MEIKKIHLQDGEYYKDIVKKTMIFVHHTAGSHRPDYTVNGWEKDTTKNGAVLAVATSYLIGGISTSDGNADWDGVIVEAFEDKYWAHHLGLKTANNTELNKKSIGIEICNYGPITKTRDGKFLNYVNKEVPPAMVWELEMPFRGYSYYHKYTVKQIESLRFLLEKISKEHGIDLKKGLYEMQSMGSRSLDICQQALDGHTGVWSHSNVRSDKFDVCPFPPMLNLFKTL